MATILVIDDEQPILEMLTMILQDEGYRVYGAHGGREGLVLTHRLQPDLILSDVLMPDLSGDVLCTTLHHQGWDRPIILMSANQHIRDYAACLAAAFLPKPFDLTTLLQLVDDVLTAASSTHARPGEPLRSAP